MRNTRPAGAISLDSIAMAAIFAERQIVIDIFGTRNSHLQDRLNLDYETNSGTYTRQTVDWAEKLTLVPLQARSENFIRKRGLVTL